jgi:hypothetical protein
MQRSAGGQLTLGMLERECLIDALLDKARQSACVEHLLGSWLRGEGDAHCYYCPEECWASRAVNLLQPNAIRRRLTGRQSPVRLQTRSG